jgi:hypothetical protein
MPRFLVQRTLTDSLAIGTGAAGARTCREMVGRNAGQGVTWLQSYVSADRSVMYCLYEGPDARAVRRAAAVNHLPVDRVTEIHVLDPYFYH